MLKLIDILSSEQIGLIGKVFGTLVANDILNKKIANEQEGFEHLEFLGIKVKK